MKKTTRIISLCLTLLAAMAGIAQAQLIIPVENASFEDGSTYSGAIPPNPSPQLGIQDWFHEFGWADVRAASNPGVTGSRALLLGQNNGGQVGQFFDSTYLVQANSIYTFSAMVGKYDAGLPGVGARLRMVFSTTPGIAAPGNLDYGADPISRFSSILNPISTTLEPISMSFDTSADSQLVGRYMAINLITIGTGDWDNYQTWDNVALSYNVIPEPSTFGMVLGGIGGIGALALLRRRSRTA